MSKARSPRIMERHFRCLRRGLVSRVVIVGGVRIPYSAKKNLSARYRAPEATKKGLHKVKV